MTTGSMPYRTANFFSCPEIPLVVILSPYLFKKMKPLSWCLSFSQERASFCRVLGMYIRRSLPPFEYKSKCPSLMCSTLICMSSLTRAQVAVDCPQTQIDGLRLVVLYQPHLIRPQVLFRDTVVLRAVLPNGKKVRGYRVFREVCASQVSFEFFYHSERPPFTMILYSVPFTAL